MSEHGIVSLPSPYVRHMHSGTASIRLQELIVIWQNVDMIVDTYPHPPHLQQHIYDGMTAQLLSHEHGQ